jgi:hypothetical protein
MADKDAIEQEFADARVNRDYWEQKAVAAPGHMEVWRQLVSARARMTTARQQALSNLSREEFDRLERTIAPAADYRNPG